MQPQARRLFTLLVVATSFSVAVGTDTTSPALQEKISALVEAVKDCFSPCSSNFSTCEAQQKKLENEQCQNFTEAGLHGSCVVQGMVCWRNCREKARKATDYLVMEVAVGSTAGGSSNTQDYCHMHYLMCIHNVPANGHVNQCSIALRMCIDSGVWTYPWDV